MDDDNIDIEGDEEVSQLLVGQGIPTTQQQNDETVTNSALAPFSYEVTDTVNIFGDPRDLGSNGREELLDMYPEPEWLSHQPTSGASTSLMDMDEQSRLLIQNMLAEEEMYFGQGTLSIPVIDAPNPITPTANKPESENGLKSNKRPREDQKEKKKVKKLRTDPNPQHVATHNTRWSENEDGLLKEGVKKYGYGSWTRIADFIGTRSALQVKNRGRHLAATGALPMVKIESKPVLREEVEEFARPPISAVTIVKNEQSVEKVGNKGKEIADDEEDIEIDITDEEENESPVMPDPVVNAVDDSDSDNEESNEVIAGTGEHEDVQFDEVVAEGNGGMIEPPSAPTAPITVAESSEGLQGAPPAPDTPVENDISSPITLIESERMNVAAVIPIAAPCSPMKSEAHSQPGSSAVRGADDIPSHEHNAENSNTPAPTILRADTPRTPQEDIQIDVEQIHPHEITHNPEWFHSISSSSTIKLNKKLANKTPDRYMKIRNHILLLWEKCRPKYLTKTAVRPGLRGEGDVNAIGRVHDYLESIGAINEGHGEKRVKKTVVETDESGDTVGEEVWITFDNSGRRKRRIRNVHGDWVDENGAIANSPIDSGDVEADAETTEERNARQEERRLMAMNSKYFADEEIKKVDKNILKRKRAHAHNHEHSHSTGDVLGSYDPFRLIPARRYSPDYPAPFRVEVRSNALIVMDFHSHLAQTEIIGLLGGKYQPQQHVLLIESVFPCNSLSTGVQCEMDPESEMKARDVFAEQGLEVVGWYHSHPTFEPNPSIRDIENEVAYQNLFQRPDGSEPFVGAIISPYDPRNPLDVSRIKFLHVSEQWNSAAEYRIPYACEKTIVASESLPSLLFNQIADLIGEYRFHEHRMDLMKPYRRGDASQTRLDKLLASIGSYAMMVGSEASAGFLARVRELVEKGFGSGALVK